MNQLLKMAFRDLGRNRRRTLLSALAVTLGLALVLFFASFVEGEMRGAMSNTIVLQSGDLQIRGASYDINKMSLDWKDLIATPDQLVQQVKSIPQVADATPRLLASGILSWGEDSRGVQVVGIDPQAGPNEVFRQGLLAGDFITADDREGILVGKPLADKFHLQPGQQVNLLINTSDGSTDEQLFTVRGIYSTNTSSYDENTVFMPLAKAQAFSGAQDHASLIFVLLHDHDQADQVAAALRSPGYQVLTWHTMNDVIIQTQDLANSFMVLFYLIVLGITATVVTNTLMMAVFERTREIGVLGAIGMKARRIMGQFLAESAMIATAGAVGGILLALAVNWYFSTYGFYIGNYGVTGMLLGDVIYSHMTVQNVVRLTLLTYFITLVSSLYPAVMASRLEPVEALHAQ